MWSCFKGHQSEKIRKCPQEGGLSAAIRNNHNRFYHAALHNISTHQSTELLPDWWRTVGGRGCVVLGSPWGNRPPAHQVQPHDLKGRAHSCSYAQSGSLTPHASSLSAAPRLMKQWLLKTIHQISTKKIINLLCFESIPIICCYFLCTFS